MANKYNVDFYKEYSYLHAELKAVSRVIGERELDTLSLVVVRLSKAGLLRDSAPCRHCSVILAALGIRQISHSVDGGVVDANGKLWEVTENRGAKKKMGKILSAA